MLLFKLAVRNLWRNTRRTLLTSGGIAFGLMFVLVVVNFQYGSHQMMLRTAIKSMAGHVVVQASGYQADKDAHNALTDSGQTAESLAQTFPEGTVLRRAFLDGALMSPSNTRMVALMGVEPEAEARIADLDDKVIDGTWVDDDGRGMVLGSKLAETLEVELGDRIVYQGEGAKAGESVSRMFRVKGIFNTGSADLDGFVAVTELGAAQELMQGTDPAHQVAVHLEDDRDLEAQLVAASVAVSRADAEVLGWRQAIPELVEFLDMDRQFADITWIILGIMVSFGVLNTVLMSVLERTREFGVMMSIGLTPRKLAVLVLMEGFVLGLLGAVVGFVLGALGTWPLVEYGVDFSSMGESYDAVGVSIDTHIFAEYAWGRMVVFSAGGILLTMFASIWPAWRVTSLRPVEAMRPQ